MSGKQEADHIVFSLRHNAEWIKEMEHDSWFGTAELQVEAADEIERLCAENADLRNAINWETPCVNCGKLMDQNYAQYCEIERLRAERDEYRDVADLFGTAFRVDEWGQYPPSNGDDVHQAVCAYERLKHRRPVNE